MALHSKIEFANLCGVHKAYISEYIKRKKIVVEDDMIDDTNLYNKTFLQKCLSRSSEPKPEKKVVEPKPVTYEEEYKERKQTKAKSALSEDSLYELEKQIKVADLCKKEVDTRIQLLREQKIQGILIPAELIKMLMSQHFKTVATTFGNACYGLITTMSKRKALTKTEEAEIRGELIPLLNSAIKEAVEITKKDIKNIQVEYSDKVNKK